MGGPRPYYLLRLESNARNRGVTNVRSIGQWRAPVGKLFTNGEHVLQAHITPFTNPNQEYALLYATMREPFYDCKENNCIECADTLDIQTKAAQQEQETLL